MQTDAGGLAPSGPKYQPLEGTGTQSFLFYTAKVNLDDRSPYIRVLDFASFSKSFIKSEESCDLRRFISNAAFELFSSVSEVVARKLYGHDL